jgi:hypothetical protein
MSRSSQSGTLAGTRSLLSVSEIEEMLKGRAESLAFELFPNGRREHGLFRVGSLAGEPGQSLFVRLSGPKVGNWRDMAGGTVAGRDRGDLLWLIACALFNGDLGDAVAWAKSWLNLDERDPDRIERHRIEIKAAAERRSEEAEREEARMRERARRRWLAGAPIAGTIAEAYLIGREIDLRLLGRSPGVLRFGEAVQYGFGRGAWTGPAMLAAVVGLDGSHVATHRTWLAPDGSGKAERPAAIEAKAWKPKKVMGTYDGAHIPLWKGACGEMPLRDIPAGTDVYASEGIEDGLTAACANPALRVICAISVANFGALELPPQMGALVLLRQNDPPGSDADRAFGRAVAAQRAKGRTVKVAPAPPGYKDLNELAMRTAQAMRAAA